MTNFPTLEPVLVNAGSFLVDRQLDRSGRVEVGVGDVVVPGDVVARTGNIEKSFTLYLASELGVPNDSLRKYLAKTVGSTVSEGEPIARVRRGLRTAAVRSPATGTLVHVEDSDGTVTLSASTGPRELRALVQGEVERVIPDRGVTIRTRGSRVYGIVGFGNEATGVLTVGIDRHDRELTADQVSKDWRGAVVLGGMTVGVPALNRLKDAGVAAVIVGSIAEGDVRRFLSSSGADTTAFWAANGDGFANPESDAPFVVVVTEGFGRYPMAEPVFQFLASNAGASASIHAQTSVGAQLSRPEIYIAGGAEEDDVTHTSILDPGLTVRVVDTQRLGSVATILSKPEGRATSNGIRREYIQVEYPNGEIQHVPTTNVEVLT